MESERRTKGSRGKHARGGKTKRETEGMEREKEREQKGSYR